MSIENILITGGTGFAGKAMHFSPSGCFATANYYDKEHYDNKWEFGRWDAIVHLAPVAPTRVLKYAKEHNSRVLFASSGAVYGGRPEYDEYSRNKQNWELECAQSGVDCVIARMFTFCGTHLHRHSLYEFIQMAKSGEITVASPDSVRSYLYADDLGRWLWRLLLEGHGIYDVGGSVPYTMLEVARQVAEVIPAKVQVLSSEPSTKYVPDVTRAHSLGCAETIGLKQAIERMVGNGRTSIG